MNRNQDSIRRSLFYFLLMFCLSAACTGLAQKTTYVGKINADKVFFRMKPSSDAEYYAQLMKGNEVSVLGTKGDYFQVTHKNNTGYVMKKFVTLSSSALKNIEKENETISKSKYAKTKTIRALGNAPGYLKYGDQGEGVEKLQRALQLKKCYDGVVDGKFGDQTTEALKNYQQKNKLSVTGKADYQTIDSLFGRVSETTSKDDPLMKGIDSISRIPLPNTTKKGNSGKHVRALQQALKLKGYFSAPIDEKYGEQTVEAVKKYQIACNLKPADGIAGNSTIKKLFGKNAANYVTPTETWDWFKDGGNVIPRGAIFTVKDVGTGKTFTCKHWSGYNHMDSEPLNKKSTETIKEIYGGSFSWDRRAILIKYNGHVYAASMNGMPHGERTIFDNGFAGHFCIHLKSSKTHETNHVDAQHQACVNQALNASW